MSTMNDQELRVWAIEQSLRAHHSGAPAPDYLAKYAEAIVAFVSRDDKTAQQEEVYRKHAAAICAAHRILICAEGSTSGDASLSPKAAL